MPGEFPSTMKAVICWRVFPPMARSGVLAITTNSSAAGPFVHHSFSPLRRNAAPSSTGVAVVPIFAGSDPTSGSVSAKADTAPRASRGRYWRFCSSVPKSLSG